MSKSASSPSVFRKLKGIFNRSDRSQGQIVNAGATRRDDIVLQSEIYAHSISHRSESQTGEESGSSITTIGNAGNANFGTNYGTMINCNTVVVEGGNTTSTVTLSELVKWLKAPSFVAILRTSLEERIPGTGQWFEQTEGARLLEQKPSVVVWGLGLPGSGKTTLSAITIQRLEHAFGHGEEVVVAYAFLRYSETHGTSQILAALISQMAQANLNARACLETIYSRRLDDTSTLGESELVSLLRKIAANLSKVFLIIDGLDEASAPVQERLLHVVLGLPNTSLLIMSRPLPHLMEAYAPTAFTVSIQAQRADIATYVEARVHASARLRALIKNDDTLIATVSSCVQAQCDGMFLLARLQMDVLSTKPNNLNTLFSWLDRLPSGIDGMYDLVLQRMEDGSEEDATLARNVFIWLLHSRSDGITVEDIQHAMGVSTDEDQIYTPEAVPPLSILLSACCGLVEIRRYHDPHAWDDSQSINELRFIHYTAKEYINRRIASNWIPDPHTLIASTCIAYMTFHRTLMNFNRWSSLHAFKRGIRTVPLLRYAWHHWGDHARMASPSESFQRSLGHFLRTVENYPLSYPKLPYVNSKWPIVGGGLHIAAKYGLGDAISSLDLPFLEDARTGFTPFHIAVFCDQVGSVRALASVYTLNRSGFTLYGDTILHSAVRTRSVRVLGEFLFDSASLQETMMRIGGIDINSTDRQGRTPLMLAAQEILLGPPLVNPGEVVSLLLRHPDIDVNKKDSAGRCALMPENLGALVDSSRLMLILAHPTTDYNARDHAGQSVLMYACKGADVRLIQALLTNPDLNIMAVDDTGKTALDWLVTRMPQWHSANQATCVANVLQALRMLMTGTRQNRWPVSTVRQAAVMVMQSTSLSAWFRGSRAVYLRHLLRYGLSKCSVEEMSHALMDILEDAYQARDKCRSYLPVVVEFLGGPQLDLGVDGRCECAGECTKDVRDSFDWYDKD